MGCPLSHRPEPPGVEHVTYRRTGRESEHGNLLAFAFDGQGLSAATGYEGQWGRSLRSSPRSGKPATWRRGTGERYAFEAGGTIRGLGIFTPIRGGYSACNERCISGVNSIPAKRIMNCGTGSQISVAYDAPGIAWPGTKGSAHQGSTG